ncbi:NATT3 protein, partial [Turnix velox]|nr:NATT3 protein [Turnix velox]
LELVCSSPDLGCNTGSYVPSRSPSCFFPYGGREWSTQNFSILVNLGSLEALSWVEASFGSIPVGAVRACPFHQVFVGRNHYGLGKFFEREKALFVVVDGEEIWFKWYQLLVVTKTSPNVTISNLSYNLSHRQEKMEEVLLG